MGCSVNEAFFDAVWSWIGTKVTFPDTCGRAVHQDNGGGISRVFSRNTVHIVIVQTDAGYAPDPGHSGTGTVVAQIC